MARPIADELLTFAQRLDDRALLLEAHHAMCPTTLWVGEPQETRTHGEQGMALYDREQHQSLAFLFGNHDPGVCCTHALSDGPVVSRVLAESRGAQPHRHSDGKGAVPYRHSRE